MIDANNLFLIQLNTMSKFKLFLTLLLISIFFFSCIKMEDATIQSKKQNPSPVRKT
jgi:PBP1b-binding outer membrane lipoprotein LpoB